MVASRIGPPVSRSTCFTSTGRDLWRNPIEERKALLRRVLDRVRCPHQIYVDHVLAGAPNRSTTCARSGAEGIVSKRAGSLFRRPRASGARPSATPPADLSLPASRNSPGRLEALHRSPPVRRRGSRACQDTRSFNKHCATTTSPRSVSLDFMFLTKLNPVYVTRMPGSEGGVAL